MQEIDKYKIPKTDNCLRLIKNAKFERFIFSNFQNLTVLWKNRMGVGKSHIFEKNLCNFFVKCAIYQQFFIDLKHVEAKLKEKFFPLKKLRSNKMCDLPATPVLKIYYKECAEYAQPL